MSSIPMIFGNGKGVHFEWGDVHFTLDLARCNEIIDMLEILDACGGEETPDDFVSDLWVGNKMMRWGGHRIPIERGWFYPNLISAVHRHQHILEDAESARSADEAMKQIVDDLDLK